MSRLRVSPKSLVKTIEGFSDASVLVLGDIILDAYIWGNVDRICPEAPVPVVDVSHGSVMLGGAANVVANLSVLGAEVELCGVVGKDADGQHMFETLKEKGVGSAGVFTDAKRVTTKKTRIVAGHQQVVRFDQENREPISAVATRKIIKYLKLRWDELDAIIISDYGKGLIHADLLKAIYDLNQTRPKIISVDPKQRNIDHYRRVTLITPNKKEAAMVSGKEIRSEEDLKDVGRKIMHQLQCENLVITLGSEGMALFKNDGQYLKVPTFAREVFDVSGAGDTVISTLTLALCSGATLAEAVILANCSAGIVVGKVGTASVTPEELKKYLQIEKKRMAQSSWVSETLSRPPLSH